MNPSHLLNHLVLLSPIERTVIDLSRRDPPSSLTRRHGLAAWVFGRASEVLPLANPRLEALRRYSIITLRRISRDIDEERRRLFDAGFAPAQIDAVDQMLCVRRSDLRPALR